jgi:hypothetical protein
MPRIAESPRMRAHPKREALWGQKGTDMWDASLSSTTVGANLATQISPASEPTTQPGSSTPAADDHHIPHVVDNPLEWPHSPFSPCENPNWSEPSPNAVGIQDDPRICAGFKSLFILTVSCDSSRDMTPISCLIGLPWFTVQAEGSS